MKIKLIRTFHAVGQGAFYSEQFTNKNKNTFNVVYDCGATPKTKSIDRTIDNSLKSNEDIDILFISHFDSDHVNDIETPKNKRNIRKVILPLLSKNQKIILSAIYESLGNGYKNILELINNPKNFFGEKALIIEVKDEETNIFEPRDIGSFLNDEQILSGTSITFKIPNTEHFWIYKPYNYKFLERSYQLIDELKKTGIKEENLENSDFIANKDNQKVIRDLYKSKKIDGGINENSMLVYSNIMNGFHSPIGKHFQRRLLCGHSFYFHCFCFDCRSPGCIFTADAELHKIKSDLLIKINRDRYTEVNNIGTIQVAHHGSDKNFDIGFLMKWEPI